jgi:hypothetical protein
LLPEFRARVARAPISRELTHNDGFARRSHRSGLSHGQARNVRRIYCSFWLPSPHREAAGADRETNLESLRASEASNSGALCIKAGHSAQLVLMFCFASFHNSLIRAATSGTWLKMRMADTG